MGTRSNDRIYRLILHETGSCSVRAFSGQTLWLDRHFDGGIMGILLGATSLQKRLAGLVINDIVPELPTGAIHRIASYVSRLPTFNNF